MEFFDREERLKFFVHFGGLGRGLQSYCKFDKNSKLRNVIMDFVVKSKKVGLGTWHREFMYYSLVQFYFLEGIVKLKVDGDVNGAQGSLEKSLELVHG
jgi:hypothetical protein